MKLKSRITWILIGILAIFSIMGLDTRTVSSPYQVVALGDSLTTGFEPGVNQPYGFVDRLYEQALFRGRSELVNYGVNGLTSSGLKDLLESTVLEKDEKAKKMKADIEQAQLITITIGGNDFRELPQLVQKMSEEDLSQSIAKGIETYGQNVTAILTMIYQWNPQAQVVIADQYQPVPPMDPTTYEKLNLATEMFASKLHSVVDQFKQEDRNIAVAQVAERFRGKEALLTHILSLDIHPNQPGYEEMAKAFAQAIWGKEGYQQVEPGNPVTMVKNGKSFNPPWPAILIQDRTYVTLREYAEALGAEVEWDDSVKKVLVKDGSNVIEVQAGSDELTVNGQITKLSAPVQLVNDKTYVPLRVLAEGFGLQVEYIEGSRTVFVNQ